MIIDLNDLFGIKLIFFYDPSRILQFFKFGWKLRGSDRYELFLTVR